MKRVFAGIGVGLAVAYLVGALVAWDVDPGEWAGVGRFFCIVIWAFVGALYADRR